MSWNLFIDDERHPKTNTPFIIARSVSDAQKLIMEKGCPVFISFDNDLGNEQGVPLPTGYDLANWLVNQELDGNLKIPEDFTFHVHSANPIGKQNIEGLLKSYLSQR